VFSFEKTEVCVFTGRLSSKKKSHEFENIALKYIEKLKNLILNNCIIKAKKEASVRGVNHPVYKYMSYVHRRGSKPL